MFGFALWMERPERFASYFAAGACSMLVFASTALADPFFVNVNEWGLGFICDGDLGTHTGPPSSIPACSLTSPGQRLPSGFTSDPFPGGGSRVLTYRLPFTVPAFDVLLNDLPGPPGQPPDFQDLIRFNGNDLLLFYSIQDITGTGDCSRNIPIATGCDGLADVPVLPVPQTLPPIPPSLVPIPNFFVVAEIGTEGNNSGLFITSNGAGTLTEFEFHSDVCSPPLNSVIGCLVAIGPPPDNPFRDITGLEPVPEPSTIWLLLFGVPVLWASRARRNVNRINL